MINKIWYWLIDNNLDYYAMFIFGVLVASLIYVIAYFVYY